MSTTNLTEENAIALIEKFESDIETCRPMLELLFDHCIKNNYDEAIEILLSKKLVYFNSKADYIAKWAIINENVGILKLLVDDDNIMLNDSTLFAKVLKKDNTEIFNLLFPKLKLPANAICVAMIEKKCKIVDTLLIKGLCPPSDMSVLIVACGYGYANVVETLLKHPETMPGYNNNYPIQKAAYHGHYEIVKLLINDQRVDPSGDDDLALRWAAANGHTKIVELLLSHLKVNPSANNNESIYNAMSDNHIDVVKLLIPRIDLATITNQKIINIAEEMESGKNIWNIIIEFMKKYQIKKIHCDKNKKIDMESEFTENIFLVCIKFGKLMEKRNVEFAMIEANNIQIRFNQN